MQPKQIIFLTPGFASDETDTSCIPALQDFISAWKAFHPEIELKVISFQYPFGERSYHWNHIEVYSAGGKNRRGIPKLMTWKRVRNRLKEWVTNDSILISYFLTEATRVAQRFARRRNILHLAIAAGQDVLMQNQFLKLIDLQNLKVICFNQNQSTELSKSTGRGADFIIPMGIMNYSSRTETDRYTDILVVGSLISVKQVNLAIKILSDLIKELPHLKAEIIGDGTERKNLEALSAQLQLNDQVSFTGEIKREQVLMKMQHAKILLHTSAYEGQSTVISEALASGMTVVCFDVGRIHSDHKIHVCNTESEMSRIIRKLLLENSFDFSPCVPVTTSQTIQSYINIIQT